MPFISAVILLPLITIVALLSSSLIGIIISYIQQKPEPNKSTFDIVASHLAWTSFCIGWHGYIALCFSLILIPAPLWLVTILEIIVYVGFIYHSAVWTVVNLVVYGFLMHFGVISQVTDTQMKRFSIGTCIAITILSMIESKYTVINP